ncbi:APC family permease [Niveispirillum sp. KHB5.9]|uniref:APC family permease n=1 Tax=Niveispirillum sp. KHB5.9 TaxID=3400269 RepID=UPI003A8C7805
MGQQSAAVSASAKPRSAISNTGFFVLAFGSIVGSGWVVAIGEWLHASGPLGSVLAFLAGGLLMALVAGAYAELLARLPRSGGEFYFVQNGIGPRAGFLVGWFTLLHIVSFTAFEAFALCWFLETLMPALGSVPALYHSIATPVTAVTLAVGLTGIATITWFNCRGAHLAVGLQRVITFGFILISIVLILIGFTFGDARNIQPLFAAPAEGAVLPGMFWTFATSLLFLSGFQGTANAIEERRPDTTMASVARALIGSVLAAALFYALIVLAVSLLRPWQGLVGEPLPAAAAFRDVLPGGGVSTLVLVAAMISLVKTWNALHLAASRLTMALARDGLLPSDLARIDPVSGVPQRAILAVALGTVLWLGMGRGAILPIINMCTICVTIIMILSLVALWRLRGRQAEKPAFVLPGGNLVLLVAIGVASLSATIAIGAVFDGKGGFPIEILLLIGWAVAGIITSRLMRHRHA